MTERRSPLRGDIQRPVTPDRTFRAQQVVATQLGCTVEQALPIIERLAHDTDEPVRFVVDELLAGDVTFDSAIIG